MNRLMRRATVVRSAAAGIAFLTVFALAGCDDDIDQSRSAAGGASNTSADTQPDTDTEEPSDTEAGDDSAGFVSGADCLVGNWYLDNESFRALMADAGGDVEVTGWAIITYNADGTTMTTYDEWTNVVSQDGAVATIVRNGEDRGTYEVTGDAFTMTETDAGSVIEMTMSEGGGPPITVTAERQAAPVSNGTFTCDAETLTVVADGGTSVLHREH